MLAGSFLTQTANVDLSALGTADWSHWGLVTSSSFDHKATAGQITTNATTPVTSYTTNAFSFTWSDGAPTMSATNTFTGVFVQGLGNSITISAPADTTPRTLHVFTDVFQGTASVAALLSDGSAPAYSDATFADTSTALVRVYTFSYRAGSPGGQLAVTLTLDTAMANGNLAVPAAALTMP